MFAKESLSLLRQRRDTIQEWLDEEADQYRLDAHTPEHAYWHHGYQAALGDVLALLSPGKSDSGDPD